MIPLDEMRRRVIGSVSVGGCSEVAIADACGSVLGSDVTSSWAYPLFDNSAMDGFAVRSADVTEPGTRLGVVGVSSAGHPFEGVIHRGEAVRILTGAEMVDGADCVVPVEATHSTDPTGTASAGVVVIDTIPIAGDHIRRAGDVVGAGDTVIAAGTELNPGHLGFLSSLGIPRVEVVSRPRVAILSTGDELVAVGAEPGRGQIFESNTVLLGALLDMMSCEHMTVHVADDAGSIAVTLSDLAHRFDVIISTGGVSMGGEYDALRNATTRFDVDVVQVAIKPAKPFAFGFVDGTVMFGLPGNPASVLVSFEMFVRPALRRMAGLAPAIPPPLHGVTGSDVARPDDGKAHIVPMALDQHGTWVRTASHGSHAISPFAAADGMLVIDPGTLTLPEGSAVELVQLWK